MLFNYVKPTDLAKDIEFAARRIYMRYGQVVGITITNNPQTSTNVANLIIRPYNSGTYSTSTKTYALSLSNFQLITFRDYFPELFVYQEIHETGNETAFLALSQPALDALTAEVNNLKDLELYWITPLAPSYWNTTDTTLVQLLETQFHMLATPTLTAPLGTVASGIISSEIDVDTFHKVAFTTSTQIGKGVYYLGLNKIPSGKVQYKLNGAGSYSTATYVGKYNNQHIYSFYSFEDYTIQLLITSADSFTVKIYDRNPIIDYTI
jgi:hypothetical protein